VGRFSEGADPFANGIGRGSPHIFLLFNFLQQSYRPLVASKRAMGLEQDAVMPGQALTSIRLGLSDHDVTDFPAAFASYYGDNR
jgi:hypothetical protein